VNVIIGQILIVKYAPMSLRISPRG